MYDARPAEIRKQIEVAAAKSREVFKGAHDEAREKRVRDQLDRYVATREKVLSDGVRLLESPLPPRDHQERWRRHFTDAGSKAAKEIASTVEDARTKTPFVTAVSLTAFRESAFFAAVAGMPLPTAQGRILEWYGAFVREQKRLEDKWKDLAGRGKGLDKRLHEVSEEVAEVYGEAIRKAAAKARDAEELFRRWFPAAEKGDEAMDRGEPGLVAGAVQSMIEALAALRPSTETLAGRFRALYTSEETVGVVLFGKTRKSVQEFLEKVNLEAAVESFEAAGKACVEIARRLPTDGMRADAEDLVETMLEEAHETLEQFEGAFEEFVQDFRGVFIGPVGDRTVSDLVDKERAVRNSDHFQRLNVQTELRKIHDAARDWFDLPLGRLPPEVRTQLEKLIGDDLERLAIATREASDLSRSERVSILFRRSWDEIVTEIKRLPGYVL